MSARVDITSMLENPDGTNRLDFRQPDSSPMVPDYVGVGREARFLLSADARRMPKVTAFPEGIASIDDLFAVAKDTVSRVWSHNVAAFIKERAAVWIEALKGKDGTQTLQEALADAEGLETRICIQQMRPFEPLRAHLPEAWRELLLLSSERQLATIQLLHTWVGILRKDAERGAAFEKQTGVRVAELDTLVHIGAIFGKFFDQAYIRQNELADASGGSNPGPLGVTPKGLKHVYDYNSPITGKTQVKPYVEVFPFEWTRIVKHLRRLEKEIEGMVQSGSLPETYRLLPAYLQRMADVYGSSESDPAKLIAIHDKELDAMTVELVAAGCPIMLMQQKEPAVAGDAEKTDVELRVGFRSPAIIALEQFMGIDQLRTIAQERSDSHRDAFTSPNVVPSQFLNHQSFAFGPNLYWMTRGESGGAIITHANAVHENAERTEFPLLKRLIKGLDNLDITKYRNAAVLDTATHEFGHNVAPRKDTGIDSRVGQGKEANALEEMKADSVGMALLRDAAEQGILSPDVLEMQLLAKIGDALNYLKMTGGSGDRYRVGGIVIMHALFEANVLCEDGDQYVIQNPALGIAALARIGDEILNQYYWNTQSTPNAVHERVSLARDLEQDQRIQRLLKKIA